MLQPVARDLAAKVERVTAERVTAASSKPLDKQRQRCVMPAYNGSLVSPTNSSPALIR